LNSSGTPQHRVRWLRWFAALVVVGGCVAAFFWQTGYNDAPPPKVSQLEHILRTGKLHVLTRNNANCYYQYRGQPMGFEHDLVQSFADFLGVRLDIRLADQWEGMIPQIRSGEGDLIAANLTITPQRSRHVLFSDGYLTVRQHIIARRDVRAVSRIEDLEGRTVHVRRGTSYQDRLEEIARQGVNLRIQLHDDVPTEELIRMVAQGEIELAAADSHIAKLNRRYYPRAVPAMAISDEQELGWAVHPEAVDLRDRINSFFRTIKQNGTFDTIYARYFTNLEWYDYVDLNAFHRRLKTRLPKYESLIKDASARNDFDWRLIAAQMYQESHFNPYAESHAGAYGLMQLTRNTANSLGVTDIYNPRQNIHAGVRHLKDMYDHFDKAFSTDRMNLALAAYNVGIGHVEDARTIARRLNLDPNRWASLVKTLPMLRFRKHYRHTRYGYARGYQPIYYIRQIVVFYDILKRRDIQYGQMPSQYPWYGL